MDRATAGLCIATAGLVQSQFGMTFPSLAEVRNRWTDVSIAPQNRRASALSAVLVVAIATITKSKAVAVIGLTMTGIYAVAYHQAAKLPPA